MATDQMKKGTEGLEHRVGQIEQVLPTLATKEDLRTTEERLRSEIAKAEERLDQRLHTKIDSTEQRLRTEIDSTEQRLRTEITDAEKRMRTHFDVMTESLLDDIRLVAEAVATPMERQQ